MNLLNKLAIPLLSIIIFIMAFKSCTNSTIEKVSTGNDTLSFILKQKEREIDALKKTIAIREAQVDSLSKHKDILEKQYKTRAIKVRSDIAIKNICDTTEVLIVLNDCDSTINASNQIIASKDSIISDLKDVVAKQDTFIIYQRIISQNKDKQLIDQEKKYKRKLLWSKVETIVVSVVAILSTALTFNK